MSCHAYSLDSPLRWLDGVVALKGSLSPSTPAIFDPASKRKATSSLDMLEEILRPVKQTVLSAHGSAPDIYSTL